MGSNCYSDGERDCAARRHRQESIGEGGLGGLRHLNLSRNRLGDQGVVALAQSLGQVARASLGLIDRIALSATEAKLNLQQQMAEQMSVPQFTCGEAETDGVTRPSKRTRWNTEVREVEAEGYSTDATLPYLGLLSLQLRSVDMHGYGAHAISMAVIAPAQVFSTPIPQPAGTCPRACCSSITDLDLSENTLGRDGASSLLMAVRVRSLMIAAGRVERLPGGGGGGGDKGGKRRKEGRPTRGGGSAEQLQGVLDLQLVGCEMTHSECTDINTALASLTPTTDVAVSGTSAAGIQVADGRGDIAGVSSTTIVAVMSDATGGGDDSGGAGGECSTSTSLGWAD